MLEKLSQYVTIYCTYNGISINPLKLQKLLYYVQAWSLVKLDKKPLFEDLPEAWVNGPVYRSIYNIHRDLFYRDQDFKYVPKDDVSIDDVFQQCYNGLELDNSQKLILDAVLKAYAPQTHDKLVYMTHSEAPWNEARKGLAPMERSTNPISLESMYEYYSNITRK